MTQSPTLIRDVLLRDGSTLRLRAPRPEDLGDIKAFYDALSDESRYLRFHGYGRTDLAARQYAEADGVDRVALIGRHGDRIVAAAGYDLLREPGAAEVAFAVADDFRGRGAATRLLEQLAQIAASRGIHRFDAEVLTSNRAMLGVFRAAGFALRRHGVFGEVTVSLDITPTTAVQERIDERDHAAVVASLRPLLAPRSVAIVGAARAPGNVGADVLAQLVDGDFRGVVTPVNRDGTIVRSMRAARTIAELDEPAELVIISPDVAVGEGESVDPLEIAEQAVRHGCRAMVVLGSHPHEAGRSELASREDRWLEVVRDAGMRLLGPGSLGIVNTDPEVSLLATAARPGVVPGRLAVCSQSGAIGIGLLGHAARRRLGISAFVSLGERIDVSTNDMLEFWEEDERTAAVMLYVETFGNPERFARIARRVSRRKPILAVRGHRSEGVSPVQAGSHTAAALRGDAAVNALLRQAGVMRFRDGGDLFNAAQYFEFQPLPAGRRVGIVSNSAGLATLAQDASVTRGLVVGEVGRPVPVFDPRSAADREGADGAGGAGAAAVETANPHVMGIRVDPQTYASAVRAMLADAAVDAVMAYYVEPADGDPEVILRGIEDAGKTSEKPVVASVVRADGRLPEGYRGEVPNFLFPEGCPAAIARGVERREWLSRPLGQEPELEGLDGAAAAAVVAPRLAALADGQTVWLSTAEGEALLASHGIPFTPSHACSTVEQAVRAAAAIGGPVALKADFEPPAHAGDVDALLLGLEGESALRAGWRELERRVQAVQRVWTGATVQALVGPGADILLGTVRDGDLGPLLAVGLGGRRAGIGADAAFRLLPVTDVDADELIEASDGVAVQLDGFRGQPPLDHEAFREMVLRLAALVRTVPEVVEGDLNPVRVMARGCTVLDLRVRIGRHRPVERIKTW